eukprot:gene13257-biopygen13643
MERPLTTSKTRRPRLTRGHLRVYCSAAVEKLLKHVSTLTVRVEDMETRGKAEGGADGFAEQVAAQIIQLNEDEITEALFGLGHTFQGVYRNLCNRHTMLQLGVGQDASPGRYSAVSATRPKFMEDTIHNTQANTARSDTFDRWFCEFENLKTKHCGGCSAKESGQEDRDRPGLAYLRLRGSRKELP